MGKLGTDRFASDSNEWATPNSIFAPLADEFDFTLDVAANADNAKCARYFAKQDDGLMQEWQGTCWMNPPFGRQLKQWVVKAYKSALAGATVVCLLPVRTNTNWWHKYCMKGEIRLIKGRPKFGNAEYGLPVPIAIVIFRPPHKSIRQVSTFDLHGEMNNQLKLAI